MKNTVKIGIAASLFLFSTSVFATSFTGIGSQITEILVNADSDGTLRISVHIPASPVASCSPNPHWYVTTPSTDPVLRAGWLALLKSIKSGTKPFTIVGTGTCDTYLEEIIQSIDYSS